MAREFFILRIKVDGEMTYHKFQSTAECLDKASLVFHADEGELVDILMLSGKAWCDHDDLVERVKERLPASPHPEPPPKKKFHMSRLDVRALSDLNRFLGGDVISENEWRFFSAETKDIWRDAIYARRRDFRQQRGMLK